MVFIVSVESMMMSTLPHIQGTPPFDYAQCRHGSLTPTKLMKEHIVWLTEVRMCVNTILQDFACVHA